MGFKIKRGEHWSDDKGDVRIMTLIDGYVVARRPRCAPFVKAEAEFREKFNPWPLKQENKTRPN